MSDIYGYKVFKNEHLFIAWQKRESPSVIKIEPIVTHIHANSYRDTTEKEADETVISDYSSGCFVVYVVEDGEDE